MMQRYEAGRPVHLLMSHVVVGSQSEYVPMCRS